MRSSTTRFGIEAPLFTRYTLYTLTSNARFTYEKAKRDLGYKPRDISATIKDTVSFLTKERKVTSSASAARRA